MSLLRTWSLPAAVLMVALTLPGLARGQSPYPPVSPAPPPAPPVYAAPSSTAQSPEPDLRAEPLPGDSAAPQPQVGAPDPATEPRSGFAQPSEPAPATTPDAPTRAAEPDSGRARSGSLTQPDTRTSSALSAADMAPSEDSGMMLDGRPRQGPFLSGPGSMTFVLHHTTMGALGGFFTQAFAKDFNFDRSSREAMLAGTLIGAGLGFGASAWWQFNHWVDKPMADFGIANSFVGAMFAAGFMDLVTQDAGVLTWSSFIGAELGAWLTAGLGGGQMPLDDGLLVASGAGWGLAYSALLLAIINFSGTRVSGKTWKDTLLIAPGIGAGALALATMRYNPTPSQILRADMFGAGVGAAVLLISGLVLGGFDQSTPYVLSFLGSAGAITTVSLLWEESVDHSSLGRSGHSSSKDRRYTSVWW
ncbi:hypothetical protein KRR26_02655 [Corallococcus sp. M34]|uniref:hypothetical protein n=1 Tax=Citreicoccus inhibens TaxID=2849499 RepID=UPI001C24B559|nr:hypothetical protein [Citreicoccus inhibens]MBU8894484.1 hypothetical protein [Citreicoccus inhibens]